MTPEPTVFTIRERIMRNMVARFEQAPSNGHDITWGRVTRKPITKTSLANENFVIGLYDTSDRTREGVGYETHNLNVVIEFHVKLQQDDDPSSFLNHCIGQVVRRVAQDIHMGDLALNCRENGSELDIDGAFATYVSGMVIFDVSYRCRPNDHYTRV